MLFIYGFLTLFSGVLAPKSSVKCYTPLDESDVEAIEALSEDVRVSSRFYELLFGKGDRDGELLLYPGGSVFGLLIDEEGVSVCSSSSCRALLTGDRILKVNGVEAIDSSIIEKEVKSSGGGRIELTILRSGQRMTVSVLPKLVDGEYKLGVTLRSRTAGIGTLTFIEPNTLSFGGLGHGVSDSERGGYVTVKAGTVNSVVLGGCKRGEPGKAGELTGVLKQDSHGTISINNECGVFGVLDELPSYATSPIPAGKRDELKAGAAEIISTVRNGKRQSYSIEIYDIDYTSTGSKSFKIRVTDPTLVALTGGIVRGMSGSPIIQDGKLVGAVTHVMVANPTEGYGIFIENMLNAANNQSQQKAA